MGYVLPRLPEDATPEMKIAYKRHLLKALAVAGNPWRKIDSTLTAKLVDAMTDDQIRDLRISRR